MHIYFHRFYKSKKNKTQKKNLPTKILLSIIKNFFLLTIIFFMIKKSDYYFPLKLYILL